MLALGWASVPLSLPPSPGKALPMPQNIIPEAAAELALKGPWALAVLDS